MAKKKYYIGSTGPFLYDDAKAIDDPDGDFAGENNRALVTDGQLIVGQAPTDSDEVVRLGDMPYGSVDVTASDVTGSRSLGTTYQNSTSNMIVAQITVKLTA